MDIKMSIPSVQIKVALRKQEHPEEYCPVKKCLWRTGGGRCPRHQIKESPVQSQASNS